MQFLFGYVLGVITMTIVVKYLISRKNKINKKFDEQ